MNEDNKLLYMSISYSQLVCTLSQTALSQKPVSWKAVSQLVSKFKKD